MTILIHFHQSHYRTFKAYYTFVRAFVFLLSIGAFSKMRQMEHQWKRIFNDDAAQMGQYASHERSHAESSISRNSCINFFPPMPILESEGMRPLI